jgi:hypothetical protein
MNKNEATVFIVAILAVAAALAAVLVTLSIVGQTGAREAAKTDRTCLSQGHSLIVGVGCVD